MKPTNLNKMPKESTNSGKKKEKITIIKYQADLYQKPVVQIVKGHLINVSQVYGYI